MKQMANYVAIELVEKADGSFTVSTYKKDNKEEAEKAFHSILSVAAVSTHPVHSAVILNPEGQKIKSECYKHEQKQNGGEN
jgi:cation transport ATPase